MPTNDDLNHEHDPGTPVDAEHPGYETTDVNVSGVAVFLAGLFGSVLIFFVVCFVLGKVINNGMQAQRGLAQPNKWHGGSRRRRVSARIWRAIRRWSRRSCSR